MEAIVILTVLALALALVHDTIIELLPFEAPGFLSRVVTVAIAAGVAYGLDYSVFTAFGQELRADWMHPIATGFALLAMGEFVRSLVAALAHRAGEPVVDAVPHVNLRAAA